MVNERELSQRKRAVMDARHTNEHEGARSTPETRTDHDAYQRGEIDVEQLGAACGHATSSVAPHTLD